MKTPVLVDAVRTPIGRAHAERGVYRDTRADDLAVTVVRALVERTGVDPTAIEDVLIGCTQQQGEQGLNVGRMIGLMAGLPAEAAGATLVKPGHRAHWGGYLGHFSDPDGFLWEVAHNPEFWVGPEDN